MAYRRVEPHEIADVLGLSRDRASYSLLDLNDDIVRGLAESAVERLRETIAPDSVGSSRRVC